MNNKKMNSLYKIVLLIFIVSGCSSVKTTIDEAYISEIKKVQATLNDEFANAKESPLDSIDFVNFKGLDFFPIDKKYRVVAKFVKNEHPVVFEIPTTTTRKPKYIKYGDVYFKLNGQKCHLEVYQNQANLKNEKYKDYLFLPFNDYTNGFTSYGGGRYIDLHIPKNTNQIVIDFNKAYNPYCAYSHRWSCPLIPSANNLKIEIKAGVKKFTHRQNN